jgi:membrane-bound serine protease (ClpP class)
MELLLNPNIAYLLLVFGFTFAILAIFSPGTGLLEVGALFALLLAGYAIYNLPFNLWALLILIIGVFPFLLALRKSKKLLYLVLSLCALIIGSIFLFRGENWWQPAVNPILAGLVSLSLVAFFWFAIQKILEAEKRLPSHDLANLVSEIGEAKTDIFLEGTVQVSGELWSAISKEKIPNGALVRVIGREGLILDVEKVEQ